MHFVTTPVLSFLVHLLVITIFATYGFGQIYHVKEMNTEQIKALDREKTVVLLPEASLKSTARTCRRFRTAIWLSGARRNLPMRL